MLDQRMYMGESLNETHRAGTLHTMTCIHVLCFVCVYVALIVQALNVSPGYPNSSKTSVYTRIQGCRAALLHGSPAHVLFASMSATAPRLVLRNRTPKQPQRWRKYCSDPYIRVHTRSNSCFDAAHRTDRCLYSLYFQSVMLSWHTFKN
jgi:hypothetical protein